MSDLPHKFSCTHGVGKDCPHCENERLARLHADLQLDRITEQTGSLATAPTVDNS